MQYWIGLSTYNNKDRWYWLKMPKSTKKWWWKPPLYPKSASWVEVEANISEEHLKWLRG